MRAQLLLAAALLAAPNIAVAEDDFWQSCKTFIGSCEEFMGGTIIRGGWEGSGVCYPPNATIGDVVATVKPKFLSYFATLVPNQKGHVLPLVGPSDAILQEQYPCNAGVKTFEVQSCRGMVCGSFQEMGAHR